MKEICKDPRGEDTLLNRQIRTCLWFEDKGEEAADFYVSLLPDSGIERMLRPDREGPALAIDFKLAGAPYQIINGGPHFTLSPAVSIAVTTPDQEETDRLWDALLEGGGKESQCGWLTDRFGLSWQIVPEALARLLSSPDHEAAARVQQAMFSMRKIDVAKLQAAFEGKDD